MFLDNFFNKAYNRKVIENHMSESIPISEAKKMRSGVNVEAEVIGKGEPRTVNLKTGGTVDVCDATISNSDGTEENQMKLTLWGDDIKAVNVGDKVRNRKRIHK